MQRGWQCPRVHTCPHTQASQLHTLTSPHTRLPSPRVRSTRPPDLACLACLRWCAELIDEGHLPGECLFAIAIAHYRLGALRRSREHVERLLRREPAHEDAQAFHLMLRDTVAADGPAGLMMVAGVAAVSLVGALLLRQRWTGGSVASAVKEASTSAAAAAASDKHAAATAAKAALRGYRSAGVGMFAGARAGAYLPRRVGY